MTELDREPSSLLDWVTGLTVDPSVRARLLDDPRAVLEEQGFAQVPPRDLRQSLPLVTDAVAARLGTEVDAATTATTVAQLDGEAAVDALARQFAVVTDVVLAPGAADLPGAPAGAPGPLDGDAEVVGSTAPGPSPDLDVEPDLDLEPRPGLGPRPGLRPEADPRSPVRPDPPTDPPDLPEVTAMLQAAETSGPSVAVRAEPTRDLEHGTVPDEDPAPLAARDPDDHRPGPAGASRPPSDARPAAVADRTTMPGPRTERRDELVTAVTVVEMADGEPYDGIDPAQPLGVITDLARSPAAGHSEDGIADFDDPTAFIDAADAPTADAPTADAPTADAPTADAPTADAPTADGPTAGNGPHSVAAATPASELFGTGAGDVLDAAAPSAVGEGPRFGAGFPLAPDEVEDRSGTPGLPDPGEPWPAADPTASAGPGGSVEDDVTVDDPAADAPAADDPAADPVPPTAPDDPDPDPISV